MLRRDMGLVKSCVVLYIALTPPKRACSRLCRCQPGVVPCHLCAVTSLSSFKPTRWPSFDYPCGRPDWFAESFAIRPLIILPGVSSPSPPWISGVEGNAQALLLHPLKILPNEKSVKLTWWKCGARHVLPGVLHRSYSLEQHCRYFIECVCYHQSIAPR